MTGRDDSGDGEAMPDPKSNGAQLQQLIQAYCEPQDKLAHLFIRRCLMLHKAIQETYIIRSRRTLCRGLIDVTQEGDEG